MREERPSRESVTGVAPGSVSGCPARGLGREWCPRLVHEDRRLIHCKPSTDVRGGSGEDQGHIHKPQLGPPYSRHPPGQEGLTLQPPGKIPTTQAECHPIPAWMPGSNSLTFAPSHTAESCSQGNRAKSTAARPPGDGTLEYLFPALPIPGVKGRALSAPPLMSPIL